jgi:hypothetical protein
MRHVSVETASSIFTTNTSGAIHSRHQQQFSINVWAGIVGDYSIGPHILSHWLTGNHYRDFLLHDLSKLLEDITLASRA